MTLPSRGLNPNAKQAELEVEPPAPPRYKIDMDPKTGLWYLFINAKTTGYWPIEQFMSQQAAQTRYAQLETA